MAEPLSQAGYDTVAVSNNTWISEEFGFGRGFERFHETWQYVQSETDLGRIARTEEGTDKVRAVARAVFDGNPVVNLANAVYGQFVRKQTDSGAKRTNEWIDEWEDTVFVVTGDHGENVGDHGLMDHQYCLYDTLLHVPLVIHGGSFTAGETVDDLVSLTDLAPTLLDETGIDASGFREHAQGRSVHPDAETEPREQVVTEYVAPQPLMNALETRVGGLPNSAYGYDRSLRAIRTEKWKLIRGSVPSSTPNIQETSRFAISVHVSFPRGSSS